MFDKLRQIESRYEEFSARLAEAANAPGGRTEYARLAKAASEIEPVVTAFGQYKDVLARIEEANHILGEGGDAELRELASQELEELRARERSLEERLRTMLVPRDARDDKNVLVEIRAGAGGDEAALFAADLARMYTKYAERHGLKLEVLDTHPTGQGGFKEVILSIQGKGAWSRLKFERGVHRVQRVPATESAGRIHTSTVTVAVLPEAEDVDVKVDDKDLKVDVYRSSGPGGRASTPPTRRCASRTCRRGSSSPARTSARRSRTGPRPCGCSAPGCSSRRRRSSAPRSPRRGRARSGRASAASGSAPTTSPRGA